jgi:hydrogenase/urease accessory protein HupE
MSRRLRRIALVACGLLCLPGPVSADVFRPAYLELRQVDRDTYDVMWKVPAIDSATRLGIDVRFPVDVVAVTQPRGTFVPGALIERWAVRRDQGLAGAEVTIDGLPASVTDVLARVEWLDGTTQVARLRPDQPRFVVTAPQGAAGVARTYTQLGIHHILVGIDHLLYILGMLFLVQGWRRILATMSAFTATHSLTLSAAALGWVHVPQPPVEACIALSIVFVAREIVELRNGRPGLTARWPWVVSFTFGLMHGFGFAGALAEVGLPQKAIPVALLFFNVGVEIGQIIFVAAVLSAVALVARTRVSWLRWAHAVAPYAIGTLAMFWVIERVIALGR